MTREEIIRRVLLQRVLVKLGGSASVDLLVQSFENIIERSNISAQEKAWISDRRAIMQSLQGLLLEGRLQRLPDGLQITPEADHFSQSDAEFIFRDRPEYAVAA